MKIYIGGPMFAISDIQYNRRLKDILLANDFEVYCPNDNQAINDKTKTDITSERIYAEDIKELLNCNVFLCRVALDCGTMWESGYMDCLASQVNSNKYFGCIGLVSDIRLSTIPDPAKSGIDNQAMYIDQFIIGGLKLSLGVCMNENELIERLIAIRKERNNKHE